MAISKSKNDPIKVRIPDVKDNISILKNEEKKNPKVGILGSDDATILAAFNRNYNEASVRHQNLFNRVYTQLDQLLTPELNKQGGVNKAQDTVLMAQVYDELTGGYVNVEVVDPNSGGLYKDGLMESINIDYLSKIYRIRRDNMTNIELIPVARALRNSDTSLVGGLNAVVTSQSRKSGFKDIMSKVADPAFRYGSGIVHGYFNPHLVDILGGTDNKNVDVKTATGKAEFLGNNYWFTEGSVVMEVLDNYTFFSDPAATSIDNARYHIIYKQTTLETLIDLKIINTEQLKDMKDLDLIYSGTSSEYKGEDNNARDYTTGVSNVCDLYIYYSRMVLPAKANPTGKDEVVYLRHYIVGKKYVAKVEVLPTKAYPIWVYNVEDLDNEILGTCAVVKLMPIQKLIQQLDNAIIFATAHAAVPQRVINTEVIELDSTDLDEYINQPGIYFKSDGDVRGAIQWLDLPSLPQDIYQFKMDLITYMDRYEGITPAYEGQNVGSIQGTGGVNSLINRALSPDSALMKRWDNNFRNMCEWFVETTQESLAGYDVMVDVPDPDVKGMFKKINMLTTKSIPYNIDYYVDYGRDKSMETQYMKMKEIFTVVMEHTQEPSIPLLTEVLRLSGIQSAPDMIQRLWEDSITKRKEDIKNGIFEHGQAQGIDVPEQALELISSKVLSERDKNLL